MTALPMPDVPVVAAPARAGDPEGVHPWAGTGYRRAVEEPAGALVARLGGRTS